MKKELTLMFIGLFIVNMSYSQKYKELMKDNKVNFYEVVKEAENYFKSHNKNVKGSGWKPFSRWKNANEYKYYPSGRRDNIDPYFVSNSYLSFLENRSSLERKENITALGWSSLGPFSIEQITGHYTAGLGRIEDHYVDPNNENIMYLGSASGGFWQSNNGGLSWSGGSTDFLPACGVNTISVNPVNQNNILINIKNSRNNNSHGIFESLDSGTTWLPSSFNPNNLGFGGLGSDFKVFKIKHHPRIPNLVFIGTNQGVFKSSDNFNSTNWTQLLNTGSIKEIEFHPTNDSLIYVFDYNTLNVILRSTDQGLSYSASNIIPNNNADKSIKLSVSTACANCLYVASTNGVWKSVDNGVNFSFLSNPDQSCGGFAVNDLDDTKMVYGYVDVAISNDGGLQFNTATHWNLNNTNGYTNDFLTSFTNSTNYVHADLHPAKCVNGVFYIGTDGLFSKSIDNGENWEILSNGLSIRENHKLGVSQSNTEKTILGSQDNGTSIKTKNGWIEFYGGDGMECLIHPLNDNWLISSLQNGGRRRSKDGGFTQEGITPNGVETGDWISPLLYDPNDQMTIYDFRKHIYKSEDFGTSFIQVGSPLTITDRIKKAAIAENNSNIIVISRHDKIEKSTDGGVTWGNIKNNLPDNAIEDIAFNPNNDDNIFVVYADYQSNAKKVFQTNNGGITWINVTYNLGSMPIRSVVIDHTNDGNIYLGAEIGIFTKTSNENNWTLYNSNLPNTTISDLEIAYGSNTLKAATWGRGLWEYHLKGRKNYPQIKTTRISDMPTLITPRETINQFVTSTINYPGTLTNVHVKWSANNPTFNQSINMSNIVGNEWVSNSALPNYPSGTKIYFKVFATGDAGETTETYRFMYTITPFEICTAVGSGNNLAITNVQISNDSGVEVFNNSSGNTNYQYYNTPVINLVSGNTYALKLTANTDWFNNDYSAWIDYNENLFFEDSEQILLETNPGSFEAEAQFTIPENMVIDNILRMRVRVSYWDNPESCGASLGEVEDYAIQINDSALGISENEKQVILTVFPNPTSRAITIDFGQTFEHTKLKIYTLLGQLVQTENFKATNRITTRINGTSGFYFLKIETDTGKITIVKIFKK